MQPAVPDPADGWWYSADEPDVGDFEPGTPLSRWALARYIVGRVILERVSWALLGLAVVLLVLGGVAEWLVHSTLLTVICVVLTVSVLLMRAVLRAVLRRLMAFALFSPVEDRVRQIIGGATGDIFTELGRVGLPSHTVTLPLLIPRLLGRRRRDTMARIRRFDIDRAVSRVRRDELILVLREVSGTGAR